MEAGWRGCRVNIHRRSPRPRSPGSGDCQWRALLIGESRHRASRLVATGEVAVAGYQEDGQRYVSSAGLRARGWTGGTVRRLLGAPDRLSVNPRFRSAPHTRLYRAERVDAAERSEEFRKVAESAVRRSDAVRAELERRREAVLERIRTEPIDVPRLDPGKLALRTVEYRARREAEWGQRSGGVTSAGAGRGLPGSRDRTESRSPVPDRDRDRTASDSGHRASADSSDRASLLRWKVDYLRHRLSHYERLLDGLSEGERSPGRAEAVTLLRRRIYGAIADAYPALAQECERRARDQ